MHIAIDLGGKKSQVCIRGNDGEILKESKVATRSVVDVLRGLEPSRVVMESCSEAFAIARQVQTLGHTPVVVPATLAPALGVGARGIKTDQRDGRNLSEASVRMKTLPSVHVPSLYAQQLKQESTSRDLLVKTRTQTVNHIKGWFRVQLKERPSGGPEALPKRVREALKNKVPEHLESVLKILDVLNQEISKADKRLVGLAKQDDVCQRLQTIPGVGPVTAVRFRGAVDDVNRFESANAIESYFGLTPGENSSSERVSKTRITKAGASEVRRLLCQCAHVAMSNCRNEPMSQWGLEIARKKNKPIAVTALARKICGIMYALWRNKTTYNPTRSAQPRTQPHKEEVAAIKGKIWTEEENRAH